VTWILSYVSSLDTRERAGQWFVRDLSSPGVLKGSGSDFFCSSCTIPPYQGDILVLVLVVENTSVLVFAPCEIRIDDAPPAL